MAIFDLFSKRQADAAKSGDTDVYQYNNIPSNLRVQVQQISIEALGNFGYRGDGYINGDKENEAWRGIERLFLREKGLNSVSQGYFSGDRVLSYMAGCSTTDWLDFLEIIVVAIELMGEVNQAFERQRWDVASTARSAIDELNYRLRQSAVGYQIENLRLIIVNSQFIHAEIVRPALSLLSGLGYEGVQQEFLTAHHHFRVGEHRQAVAMAANALESTFKAIFQRKGWVYQNGSRITDLVKIARNNRMWPDYLDSSFDQLIATLQSGLPKIRDNDAAHGQGAEPREVPGYIAAYALHLAASKIIFLTEAAK